MKYLLIIATLCLLINHLYADTDSALQNTIQRNQLQQQQQQIQNNLNLANKNNDPLLQAYNNQQLQDNLRQQQNLTKPKSSSDNPNSSTNGAQQP